MVGLIETGISGLDSMLYGGVPKDNQIILAGGPGAGKTLLAFEFIYKGAKMGETGIFFALEEDPKKIIQNAKEAFSEFTDIDDLIKSGKIIIDGNKMISAAFQGAGQSDVEFGSIVSSIEDTIVKNHATRAVLDSSSALELVIRDPQIYRRSMWALAANFRRLGVTSLLTAEIQNPDRKDLIFKPEHFIFDGMIIMYLSGDESRRIRALEIIKMRGHDHSFVTAPYDITASGFDVFSPEAISK